MDDFVVNVRQIGNYPATTTVGASDLILLQQGGLGGAYASITPPNFVSSALLSSGWLRLAPGAGGIAWNGASLTWDGSSAFTFNDALNVPSLNASGEITAASITAGGIPVATQLDIDTLAQAVSNSVTSFNGRTGAVQLQTDDVRRAGAAPIWNPNFGGVCTAPTIWNARDNSTSIATTGFVQAAICANFQDWLKVQGVTSFNTRIGDVVLNADDITQACRALGAMPQTNTAPFGDSSYAIANTMFVDGAIIDVMAWTTDNFVQLSQSIEVNLQNYAPLNSPAFTGMPTAPTPPLGNTSGQIATTAFVMNAVQESTTGVSSFNTRTGAVVLDAQDLTDAGGALLVSPNFSGTPQAPTAPIGTATGQIATTQFVTDSIGAMTAGVSSFNGRSGVVSLLLSDVTGVGGAPIAAPAFTGVPTAATATPGTNTTQLATTAFVQAALSAAPGGVSSFNGRTGAITFLANDLSAVGGALLASPAFTGAPTAPNPAAGSNGTQIATTAWVTSAIASMGVVSTFNGRAGAVTLTATDVANANGAIFRQADVAPSTAPNTLWFDSLNGQLYVNYVDPSSQAQSWVIANSTQGLILKTNIQVFTALGTSTYTPSAGMVACMVECIGAGAGGAGVNAAGAGAYWLGGCGGGGGSYSRSMFSAAQIGASQPVFVATGGASSVGGNGGNGGTTTFGGTLVTAPGGSGGAAMSTGNYGGTGPGGNVGTGQVAVAGEPGGAGTYLTTTAGGITTVAMSGRGARSVLAGQGGQIAVSSGIANGSAGNFPGGGGSGGVSSVQAASSVAGGAGAQGVCIITEFIQSS